MNSAIHISRISTNQLDTIISLGENLQSEESRYEPLLVFNRKESHTHYQQELSNPDALIIAALLEDDTIVGYQYSYIHTLDYLSEKNRECVLEALYILPEFRSQGIGKLLVAFSEDWAIQEKTVDRLVTHIYSENEASVQLHIKHGFMPYNTELIKHV